jgi:hypothetical protein
MKKRLFFGSTVAFIASPPALAVDRLADGETVLSSWSARLGYRYEF